MSAPSVSVPKDVAALRVWLRDQWAPGRPFATVAAEMFTHRPIGLIERVSNSASDYAAFERRTLDAASLWWVGAEMVDLLTTVAPTIPDDLVWADLTPPAPAGFVVLAHPIIGIDSDTPGHTVQMDAFAWGGASLPPMAGHGRRVAASVSTYRRVNWSDGLDGDGLSHAIAAGAIGTAEVQRLDGRSASLHGESWVPLGRSDWPIGDRISSEPWPVEPQRLASIIEDRRLLAALFVLLRTEAICQTTIEHLDRHARRRHERERVIGPPDVQIIALRRPKHEQTGDDGEHHAVDWSCQWIVGPHVRMQPFGPGRSQRRAIIVGPYRKGPADKPLRLPQRVHAWVR